MSLPTLSGVPLVRGRRRASSSATRSEVDWQLKGGRRYVDVVSGLRLLCIWPGQGWLQCEGRGLIMERDSRDRLVPAMVRADGRSWTRQPGRRSNARPASLRNGSLSASSRPARRVAQAPVWWSRAYGDDRITATPDQQGRELVGRRESVHRRHALPGGVNDRAERGQERSTLPLRSFRMRPSRHVINWHNIPYRIGIFLIYRLRKQCCAGRS